jgi:selenocysteine lyase/cysteine desulfurase
MRVGGPDRDPQGAPQGPARQLTDLVGAGQLVPCLDGSERPYRDLDSAASTPAMAVVAARVAEFLPWYSSVHRGAGYKSRISTAAYEGARRATLSFAGRTGRDDVAILCRNTTEAINHLAFRLALGPEDVVVTTVVEHHANLLPWARATRVRWVECGPAGTFALDDVIAALEATPRPRLISLTAASNVTGWQPPIAEVCEVAHEHGIPVALDAAQLAAHRPLPAGPDYVALSGHKLYAPFGCGALIGPRATFAVGEPFLAGGGAVDLVDLDEVVWTTPPEREEAGSPNVVGAVALGAAMDELGRLGWDAITAHESALAWRLRAGLAAIDGVTLLGPALDVPTLAIASFTVDGLHHALVAARLSAEWGIGVRHGCFCAHPYLLRLLGVGDDGVQAARRQLLAGDRRSIPGAVRASCGLGTTEADVDALLAAVAELAEGAPAPVAYVQDRRSGDYFPQDVAGWLDADPAAGAGCAIG